MPKNLEHYEQVQKSFRNKKMSEFDDYNINDNMKKIAYQMSGLKTIVTNVFDCIESQSRMNYDYAKELHAIKEEIQRQQN